MRDLSHIPLTLAEYGQTFISYLHNVVIEPLQGLDAQPDIGLGLLLVSFESTLP